MTEPKNDPVRIALPPGPENTSPSKSPGKNDTVRIVLPSRTPAGGVRRVPPKLTPVPSPESDAEPAPVAPRRPPVVPPKPVALSPLLAPLPNPPALAETERASATHSGPKNETARIRSLPQPASNPAISASKTQSLPIRLPTGVRPAPVIISSKPLDPFELLPRSFCWGLFGIASLIFLIQIWNYVVS